MRNRQSRAVQNHRLAARLASVSVFRHRRAERDAQTELDRTAHHWHCANVFERQPTPSEVDDRVDAGQLREIAADHERTEPKGADQRPQSEENAEQHCDAEQIHRQYCTVGAGQRGICAHSAHVFLQRQQNLHGERRESETNAKLSRTCRRKSAAVPKGRQTATHNDHAGAEHAADVRTENHRETFLQHFGGFHSDR